MSGYRRGYRSRYGGNYRGNYSGSSARQHIEEANELHDKYGSAFEQIKSLFLNLDDERMSAMLDVYGREYGPSAGEYAVVTHHKWRNGTVKMGGQTMARLFDLLPQFMTPNEKLELIKALREQTIKGLRQATVNLTVSHPSDLTAVVEQAIGMVRRTGEIELPSDFHEVQGWITQNDSQAMERLAKDAEIHIATQRLADLMVHLAMLASLKSLAAMGLHLKVKTRFEIPTASITIAFTDAYWKNAENKNMADKSTEDLDDVVVKLQDLALRQEHHDGNLSFVDYVMRTLSPKEQEQLRILAATEGVRTEVLLKELQVKTITARGDIQSSIDTAEKLKAGGHSSKISSTHVTASGTTHIQIENKKGCGGLFILAFLLIFGVTTSLLVPTAFGLFPARAQMNTELQMPLGNPDKAPSGPNHYLIVRPQFTESYNDSLRFPNVVAWHLSKQDVGQTERGQFAPDTSLPSGMTVVLPSDYTRSGYDRGHNCPSKDRSDSRKNNDTVFYMTNMTPQAHGMNAGPWAALESYSRDLAFKNNELLIYCGHGFSDKTHKTIGPNKIAVPDFGWKVVVVVPAGRGDLVSRVTPTTRVIAVKMPNINTVSKNDWRKYRTSVQDIEAATGLVFFDKLPKATADALKNRVDFDGPAVAPIPTTPTTPTAPTTPTEPTPPTATPASPTDVWVNLSSGVYWKPAASITAKPSAVST